MIGPRPRRPVVHPVTVTLRLTNVGGMLLVAATFVMPMISRLWFDVKGHHVSQEGCIYVWDDAAFKTGIFRKMSPTTVGHWMGPKFS